MSEPKPLAGVPIFLCRVPLIAAGDGDAARDFLERLSWIPAMGYTLFGCVHQPICRPATQIEWQAVAAMSPAAQQLVARILG